MITNIDPEEVDIACDMLEQAGLSEISALLRKSANLETTFDVDKGDRGEVWLDGRKMDYVVRGSVTGRWIELYGAAHQTKILSGQVEFKPW